MISRIAMIGNAFTPSIAAKGNEISVTTTTDAASMSYPLVIYCSNLLSLSVSHFPHCTSP